MNNSSTLNQKLFVQIDFSGKALENDLPSDDPLAAVENLDVDQALQTIYADFNSIAGAYIQLVDESDPEFSTLNAQGRLIVIQDGSASGLSGGEAKFDYENDRAVQCSIVLTSAIFEGAQRFISVTTHELGHCLGLDHPQELTQSVMSYFAPLEIYRLQADDKMGIVFLYPNDPGAAQEESTLGLSCTPKGESSLNL